MRALGLAIGLPLVLLSCAGTNRLSDAEKQQVQAISVAATLARPYDLPVATSDPNAMQGWRLASVIFPPAIVGMLIAWPYHEAQACRYEEAHRGEIATIRANAPFDLATGAAPMFADELRNSEFFARRLQASGADTQIHLEVLRCGLARLPGEDRHTPLVEVMASMEGRNRSVLLQKKLTAAGFDLTPVHTSAHAPLANYAADTALLRRHFTAVANCAAKHLAEEFCAAAR